jgi:hypothetical protein
MCISRSARLVRHEPGSLTGRAITPERKLNVRRTCRSATVPYLARAGAEEVSATADVQSFHMHAGLGVTMTDHRITLGSRLADAARPTFLSKAGPRALLIELDTSAMFKLVPASKLDETDRILDRERPRIAAAAQRLLEQGFYDNDGELVLTLTGLDL